MEYRKVAGNDKPVSRIVFGADRLGSRRERLNCRIDEGKITAIGASNWTHERIDHANAVATSHGLKLFRASTVQFSLADSTRSPWPCAVTIGGEGQRCARERYSKHGLSVFACSSLARGFSTNRYDPNNPARNPVSHWCATYFGTEKNVQRLQRGRMFARRHHVTVAQSALEYVLRYPLQVFAVFGCTTPKKSANSARAQSLKLDRATLQRLATGEASR
jgi:aryl-alcohol dehydrogenase-like predicted oxidoreductase